MDITKAIELIQDAGNLNISPYLIWGLVSLIIFQTCNSSIRIIPGFPEDFLLFVKRKRSMGTQDFANYFIQQIDVVFSFRRTERSLFPFAPKFFRTVIASMIALILGTVYLLSNGQNVLWDAYFHASGQAIAQEIQNSGASLNASLYNRLESQYSLVSGTAILGAVTAVFAFAINFVADYFSIAQTRRFIEIIVRMPKYSTLILFFDIIISIIILIISVTISIFTSSIIIYIFFVYNNYEYEYFSNEFVNFIQYFVNFCVPTAFITISLLIDGFLNLFSISSFTPKFIVILEEFYQFSIPFPTQRNVFTLLIISSLITSIWIWLCFIGMSLSFFVNKFPLIAKKAILWTKAEENPTRLFSFFVICAWTVFWIAENLLGNVTA